MRDGRKVWERDIRGVPLHTSAGAGLLAADRGVAVAFADQAVHGYGLADGAPAPDHEADRAEGRRARRVRGRVRSRGGLRGGRQHTGRRRVRGLPRLPLRVAGHPRQRHRQGARTPEAARAELAVYGDGDRLWTFDAADGTRRGESDGTPVRGVTGRIETAGQLIRAGDTWVWVDSDGDAYPPVLAFRP